jgi:predicted nuclease of restriction endonuclease-like (RecB) superfamily
MRLFYESYAESEKLAPLVREIGWTHNIVILEKCKDELEQEFYLRMTRRFGWTKNVLIHQIENRTYEKTLLNQTNFDQTLPESIQHQAKLAVKDEYTFDFLELGDEYSERQLESAILERVKPFLKEMGGMFAFMTNSLPPNRLQSFWRELNRAIESIAPPQNQYWVTHCFTQQTFWAFCGTVRSGCDVKRSNPTTFLRGSP